MGRILFDGEFEVNASRKMLYPYISTASGLSQWFADDVNVNNQDKILTFIWDGEENAAKIASQRLNSFIKFEFFPRNEEEESDPCWVEIKLDMNELTQSVFIKITDYSDIEDEDELQEIWDNNINSLRDIVGG
ncbi:MAG: START-like domain-containing protein [Bacteroidetes bacterium]|nr:START-like domain-containing protein [Bacteroidota bacterium]MDA1119661.1 START-like domain-containing protein [Bacteroidota bacterium]